MRRLFPVIAVLLAFSALAGSAYAQDDAAPKPEFDIGSGRVGHGSETEKYAETGIGEFAATWAVYYTARSYNITDIRELDQPLASNWLESFDFWGLGIRNSTEYRVSPDWRLNFAPRADVAYGILNQSYDNTHELQNLPLTRNVRGGNDTQKLSVRLEFEFAVRWRYIWFIAKADTWMSFRKRHIKANDSDYYLPQLGQLDLIEDRDRVEWESAIVYGGATGIGFDLMFMREATRLHLQFLARPYNVIRFRDGQGVSTGFEFVMRTADYELSDQFGLYFEASVQGFLPIDREFNDIYYSQFSIGFRFR